MQSASHSIRSLWIPTVSLAALAGGLGSSLAGLGWPGTAKAAWAPGDTVASAPSADAKDIAVARSLSNAFRGAAARISPAVVAISTVQRLQSPTMPGDGRELPLGQEELFRRFFGLNPGRGLPLQIPEQRGQGSGFVVRADGHILTNNHVVANAGSIEVTFIDGRQLKAELVAADPDTDLAVIKVEASDLPMVEFGDSSKLEPGEWVVAVGNPYGLEQTVTAGIISALGRGNVGLNTYEDFIQTDTAINPGNSGGPLVDLEGRVVGVNSAIRTSNGGSDGISFAIPAHLAEKVTRELIDGGKVERGWLGISMQPLTPELAKKFDHEGGGVLISAVIEGTPAERAGLRSGDILLQLDGQPVADSRELLNRIGARRPGEFVEVGFLRAGERETVSLELARRPDSADLASNGQGLIELPIAPLGLSVEPLKPEVARELRLISRQGLLITAVEPGSPAAAAGLRPEDVILEVNHIAVDTARDLRAALSSSDRSALFKVERSGRISFLLVKQND
jgi:serine protease Do